MSPQSRKAATSTPEGALGGREVHWDASWITDIFRPPRVRPGEPDENSLAPIAAPRGDGVRDGIGACWRFATGLEPVGGRRDRWGDCERRGGGSIGYGQGRESGIGPISPIPAASVPIGRAGARPENSITSALRAKSSFSRASFHLTGSNLTRILNTRNLHIRDLHVCHANAPTPGPLGRQRADPLA
jgi:hypothetical protein